MRRRSWARSVRRAGQAKPHPAEIRAANAAGYACAIPRYSLARTARVLEREMAGMARPIGTTLGESFELDARFTHHLPPPLGIRTHHARERLARRTVRFGTELVETLAHVGHLERSAEFFREPVDDSGADARRHGD